MSVPRPAAFLLIVALALSLVGVAVLRPVIR